MARLVCDPHAGVTAYDLEVNGAVGVTPIPAQPDGSVSVELVSAQYPPGTYTFRLRARGSSTSWSDWSSPLVATKHDVSAGLRIES